MLEYIYRVSLVYFSNIYHYKITIVNCKCIYGARQLGIILTWTCEKEDFAFQASQIVAQSIFKTKKHLHNKLNFHIQG